MNEHTISDDEDGLAVAQRLRDEGRAMGLQHAGPLMDRVLDERKAATRELPRGWHGLWSGGLERGGRLRLASAALALSGVVVLLMFWLRQPTPAPQPNVDVLSQISLGGL